MEDVFCGHAGLQRGVTNNNMNQLSGAHFNVSFKKGRLKL